MIQNHGVSSFFQQHHTAKQIQPHPKTAFVSDKAPLTPQSAANKRIALAAYLITGLNQIPLSLLTIHTTTKEYLKEKNKLSSEQIRVLLKEVQVGQGVSTAIYLLSYFGGAPLINWCTRQGVQRLQRWASKETGNTVGTSAHPANRHSHKINRWLNQLPAVKKVKQRLKPLSAFIRDKLNRLNASIKKVKQRLKPLNAFIRDKLNRLNASIQDKNNKTLWECIYGVIAGFIGYGYIRPIVKAKIMKKLL